MQNSLPRGVKYRERISSGFRSEEDILSARKSGGVKYCHNCSAVFASESAKVGHKGHETSLALMPQAMLSPTSTVLTQVWFSEMDSLLLLLPISFSMTRTDRKSQVRFLYS